MIALVAFLYMLVGVSALIIKPGTSNLRQALSKAESLMGQSSKLFAGVI